MNEIHDTAARGFHAGAEAYERGRPDYPDEAVDHLINALGLGPGRVVVDVGAGTGKLTRLLVKSGAEIIAVEPVEAMRDRCSMLVPTAKVVEGSAEHLPLPAHSVDAIVVAQAFHWFDGDCALHEFHRVLKPGGRLGLIWNVRDHSAPLMRELTRLMEPYEGHTPHYRNGKWRESFDRTDHFSALDVKQFVHVQRGPPKLAIDRVLSVSYMALQPEEERAHVAHQIRELLNREPETAGRPEIELRYRTDVFTSKAK